MSRRISFFWILLVVTGSLPCLVAGADPSPATPSALLSNGGFEGAAPGSAGLVPGWERQGGGYVADSEVRHGGAQSIRCDNRGAGTEYGAHATIVLNQTAPAPILISGWSKAWNVSGSKDEGYSLYVDLEYTDGTPLWGQIAPFSIGTHDWQRRQVLVLPVRPVRSASVFALFRHHTGTVWFDDFAAREIGGPGIFDGQAIGPAAAEAVDLAKMPAAVIGAPGGLELSFNKSGAIDTMHIWKRRISSGVSGGFYLRDAASESGGVVPVRGQIGVRADGGVTLTAPPNAQHLRIQASFRPEKGAISVDGSVTDTTGTDRAVTVYLVLPVRGDGSQWGQDIRHADTLLPNREYTNQVRCGAGATGGISLYPFACVSNSQGGVGIANQVESPGVYRLFYNGPGRQLVLARDFALTGRSRMKGSAHFACTLFALSPAESQWGFRAAAAEFYRLNPQHFTRRATAEGIWMPFTSPAKIAHPEDFGIAYHEGDNSVRSDNQEHVLSFRYTEPMTYWLPMPPAMPRTYENALALLHRNAATGTGDARDFARATLDSGTYDETGRLNFQFRNEPWANGAVFVLNPNPALPATDEKPTRASLAYTPFKAGVRFGAEATGLRGRLDGEYLDSLEGWGETLDYRPEHLAASPYPLTFDTDEHRPVLPEWFSTYAFTRFLSDDLHHRGRLLMANSTPIRFSIFAPVLDVMGIEVDWNPGGKWSPDSDETFNLRRTLSGTKPYLLLMNTDFRRFGPAEVERYFQRSLFYGVYPSMFSANAASNPYWENPALYNRDRPLFKKYIPILQRLSAAGWQPVTHAQSATEDLWVERFGDRHFTVFNPTGQAVESTITVDLAALGIRTPPAKPVDLITGDPVASRTEGGRLILSLKLAPETVAALELK